MTFTFKPSPRSRLRADRATIDSGPAVWLSLFDHDGRAAAVFIPVDRLEEVIAGLRAAGRQSAGAVMRQLRTPSQDCQCLPATATEGQLYCDMHLAERATAMEAGA